MAKTKPNTDSPGIRMNTEQMLDLLEIREEDERGRRVRDQYFRGFESVMKILRPDLNEESMAKIFNTVWDGGRVSGALQARDTSPNGEILSQILDAISAVDVRHN